VKGSLLWDPGLYSLENQAKPLVIGFVESAVYFVPADKGNLCACSPDIITGYNLISCKLLLYTTHVPRKQARTEKKLWK
jgi:hypothetical protein